MIDGIVLKNIAFDLNNILVGGRVDKITQPEKDELLIHIRAGRKKQRLLLSAQASMPRIHLTFKNKKNPLTPPSFCMLLRKYIGNGRILSVEQLGMERILKITLEQLNELGDLCRYGLIIEIMGKHSNIILINDQDMVLDSIKRIGYNLSSVRQVFPNKTYELPPNQDKKDITLLSSSIELKNDLSIFSEDIFKSIYQQYTGISPFMATHLCYASGINSNTSTTSLTTDDYDNLFKYIQIVQDNFINSNFKPVLLATPEGEFKDYHSMILTEELPEIILKEYDDISTLIDSFYETKALQVRMKQKTFDLRRLIQTSLDRCYKKFDIQNRQQQDTENMGKFKIKGELILANQYLIKPTDTEVTVLNYYTNEEMTIVLDPNKTSIENANKAFDKYNKKKRTLIAVKGQIKLTNVELQYLESVKYAVENVTNEEEIEDIRKELMETGYIRFKKSGKHSKLKSKPHHYISSQGFHMYVGKNNLQNEELSMKFANNSDWWFHTKDVPGSHVIVKSEGKELSDKGYEEAAALAAFYSKAKYSTKVAVDYTQKKNLKKPHGTVPGYVIYHTNYSLFIEPSIDHITYVEPKH